MISIAVMSLRRGAIENKASRLEIVLAKTVILLLPFFGISLANIGNVPILRLDNIAVALFVLVFGMRFLSSRGRISCPLLAPVLILVYVATLTNLLTFLFAGREFHFGDAMTTWLQLALSSIFFISFCHLRLTEPQIRSLLRWWIVVAVAIAAYGIYQAFARNLDLPLAYLQITNPSLSPRTVGRVWAGTYESASSVFVEPSHLGAYLVGPLIFTTVLIVHGVDERILFRRTGNLFVASVIWCGILASMSVGAFATLGIVMFIALFSFERVRKSFGKRFFVITTLTLALLGFLGSTTGIESAVIALPGVLEFNNVPGRTGSLTTRIGHAWVALKVWWDHPLLGVGLDQLQYYSWKYPRVWFDYGVLRNPNHVIISSHNIWVQSLTDMGIMGLLALALLWGKALRYAYYIAYNGKGVSYAMGAACALLLWNQIVNGLYAFAFHHPLRWFELGLVFLLFQNLSSIEAMQ